MAEQATRAMTQPGASRKAAGDDKYLSFGLASQEYALAILRVQEIIGLLPITRVPRTPEFVRGVINLRGKIIPVVDLRLKFGLEAAKDTERTCIIVAQITANGRDVVMGIIVDEVSEVLDIDPKDVELPPDFGFNADRGFLQGMGKVGDKVLILLNIDQVLSTEEVIAMDQVTQA